MLIVALVLVIMSAQNITPVYGGCIITSILVHYFALVAVMFMAAEALLMFRKLATPFAKITNKYNIIASGVCWCKYRILHVTCKHQLANYTDSNVIFVIVSKCRHPHCACSYPSHSGSC